MVEQPAFVSDLVLVGGGHAHVQVVKMLAMNGPPDLRVTLVSENSTAIYSGMLPGCVAGLYQPSELEIELRPLARWAGARFIEAAVASIDPKAKVVRFHDRPELSFDVLSIDVGSTTRGADIPGVREHALATRPIGELMRKIETFERENPELKRAPQVVVLGGGAAGIELSFGFFHRFKKRFGNCHVTLVDRSETPLLERGSWTSSLVQKTMAEKGIARRLGVDAQKVEAGKLHLSDGGVLPFDLLVWAGGGAPPKLAGASGLALCEEGFIKVRPTLQAAGFENIFAAGDCITIDGYPKLPKAGVYAVREGPYLARNILAHLTGATLTPYVPQRNFLALLMTGDGSAIASRNSLAARGTWVWRWKDHIDRRFMNMFVPRLIPQRPMHQGPPLKKESTDPNARIRCAGCGGKVGGTVLSKVLSNLDVGTNSRVRIGLSQPDDAAVVSLPPTQELVQTIDHFRAFFDDPYLTGRIAAVHAASDVFAMGGKPDTALAFATMPHASDELMRRDLQALMAGMVRELKAMGTMLIGGHTSEGAEFSVGLVINGLLAPDKLLTKKGLRAGDRIILTKPLGTGTILAADMRLLPVGKSVTAAIQSMLQSNGPAAEILIANDAHALTDVTGFGLAVHLGEMLEASGMSASIVLPRLPILDGARACFAQGVRSSLHESNLGHLMRRWEVNGDEMSGAEIIYDPQTSGGLLAGVSPESASNVVAQLRAAGYTQAAEIGEVIVGERKLNIRADGVSAK